MSSDIFSSESSIALAESIARRQGIRIEKDMDASKPYAKGSDTMVVGQSSIYNHKEYMEDLHGCIGHVAPEYQFFQDHKPENKRQEAHMAIIKDMVADRYLNGDFEGRDRQIANGYKRRLDKTQELIGELEDIDPTAAALLALGNECRNEWQSYNKLDVSPQVERIVKALQPIKDDWLSLETEEDLQKILRYILDHEDDDGGDGDGEGEGDQEGEGTSSGDGEGDSSGSEGEGNGEGDSDEGEGQSQSPDNGTGEGEEQEGEGTKGGHGDAGGFMRDNGILPDHYDKSETWYESPDPYVPSDDPLFIDLKEEYKRARGSKGTTSCSRRSGAPYFDEQQFERIMDKLEGYNLSTKVAKYLLALAQDRMQLGLRKGKFAPSRVAKLYTHSGNGQPAMFKKKLSSMLRKDVAVTILVDHSGSMRGRKYDVAAASCIAMSEVLQTIDIPHEVLTFNTGYRQVYNSVGKAFAERWCKRDELAGRLCSGDHVFGANADGESIMWAMSRLCQREERDKLLIVLSDGAPAFGGAKKGSDPQYLKDVVELIEGQRGVDILGIGIMDSNVKRYYTRHKVLQDVSELEAVFMALIKEKVLR